MAVWMARFLPRPSAPRPGHAGSIGHKPTAPGAMRSWPGRNGIGPSLARMMLSHPITAKHNAHDDPVHAPAALHGVSARLWPIFVLMWLLFIITGPVAAMLDGPLTPMRMLAALAWTVAFFAVYLWLMLHTPFRDAGLTVTERRTQVALLIALTGLVLYIDIAYPPGWFWLFIYVVMAVGVVLPTRAAIWTVAAITLLAAGVDAARSQWDIVWSIPGIALWGASTIILRRLVLTVDELREAREDLARLAVAEERLRFSRDLHDLLGHSLSLIALKSELAKRLAATDSERAAAEIADVERVARQALREVREAVTGYRQPTLAGELAGVRDLLDAAGIEARVDTTAGSLPPEVDAILAWTVREGTTNVIRHSRARHCAIRVFRENGSAIAAVSDDGRGLDALAPDSATGSGLSGLAERVTDSGGQMAAGAAEGGGFRLHVVVPLASGSDSASTNANGIRP